jgi:hypothetical protein
LRNIGADSTPRHFANSIWKLGRPVLILVLMAFAVFAVGPQLGSVDADQDGYAEVSVVVANARPTADLSSSMRRSPRLKNIYNAVALTLMAVQPYRFGIDESEFPLPSGRSALQSFCVLRC